MKLTTKGRYAVTAMLDVALHADDAAVTLSDIAERQKLSVSYLEQLFGKLRRAGLVSSVRGPGGGYRLARSQSDIRLADIIVAVDEPTDVTQCKGRENCRGESRCLTHDLWNDLSQRLYDYLNGQSLQDLVAMAARTRDRRAQRSAARMSGEGEEIKPMRVKTASRNSAIDSVLAAPRATGAAANARAERRTQRARSIAP
ncbi:MAG: Rrf2 family transcriptional regulator [Thioalkalivibrionaceae bacterium]